MQAGPNSQGRSDGGNSVPMMAAGVAVFLVPFRLFYRLILFHFYIRGAMLYDSGLLGSLMWHGTAALPLLPSLGGESFFAFHVAPILWLVAAVSDVLPVSMPQTLAGFIGISHGLLALAMFWLFAGGYGMRRGWALGLAATASCAFAFSGLAVAIARFPHFEMFAAACLLLVLVALVLERPAIAAVAFVFALATREDIGLHAFGFLALWMLADRLRGIPLRQDTWVIGFALAGLLYSALALLIQHLAFPGHSSFGRIYLGDPPFAGLDWQAIAGRLEAWAKLHTAIIVPAIATALWASRTRNGMLMLGYAACLPWALLHLLAHSQLAGWMVAYYAFPFVLAMAWPWLALRLRATPDAAASRGPALAAGLLLMVALSQTPIGQDWDEGRMPLPAGWLHTPSAARQALTDRAVAAIAAGRPALGQLSVDESVVALSPFSFARAEIAGAPGAQPDTVVFFEHGFNAELLRATDLPNRFAIAGTEIRIATNRPPEALRGLGVPIDATR